jgi:hypothetical protein
MTIFYQGVTVNQAVAPILAYLVGLMEGIAGLKDWQWIFIVFGETRFTRILSRANF